MSQSVYNALLKVEMVWKTFFFIVMKTCCRYVGIV